MMNLFLLFLPAIIFTAKPQWGFYAHKEINYHAVFTLPPDLSAFYKANIDFIKEEAVTPDKRRYAIKDEAARHYIDLDEFENHPKMSWNQAVLKFSEDTLKAHGILPWHLQLLKKQLTEAFKEKDIEKILRISADAGHYIADANVPLHTTRNYNGQFTGQEGIHGFWESRLPELYLKSYNLFTGRASYIENFEEAIWNTIISSNKAVDSVLTFEKKLNASFQADKKYSFEEKGTSTVKVYSAEYSQLYHDILKGQVERQIKKSIHLTGSFWYTCWIDAGKPVLEKSGVKTDKKMHKTEKMAEEHGCNGIH